MSKSGDPTNNHYSASSEQNRVRATSVMLEAMVPKSVVRRETHSTGGAGVWSFASVRQEVAPQVGGVDGGVRANGAPVDLGGFLGLKDSC